jgi:hypothetical protein
MQETRSAFDCTVRRKISHTLLAMKRVVPRASIPFCPLVLAGLFLIFALLYGRPVIQNDGISYYALTVSLLHDGDFNLENQYRDYPEIHTIPSATGRRVSAYSCGYALLYVPFLFLAERAAALFPALAAWHPYAQNVRFPVCHGLAIFFGNMFYSFTSIWLSSSFLIHRYKTTPAVSILFALAPFVGSSLMFYTFTAPSFAQASDAFLVALSFYLTLSDRPFDVWNIRFRNVFLGFVLALSTMLRNNNVVLIPVMTLALLYRGRREGLKRTIVTCLEIFTGALPILMIQLHFNFTQYGSLFATGYKVPGPTETLQSAFLFYQLFFRSNVGLYVWAPIALLGTCGLIYGTWKRKPEAALALAAVTVVVVSIRSSGFLWPGASFGQRLLTHLYIYWVVGLAEAYCIYKIFSAIAAGVLMLWTFLLFNLYFIISTSPEGRVLLGSNRGSFTPRQMIETAAKSYQDSAATNPFSYWHQSLGSGPFPNLQHILFIPK